MSKSGIIITFIGIGLFLISIFASEGYDQQRTIMGNMYSMEVVIYPGRLEVKPVEPLDRYLIYPESEGKPRPGRDLLSSTRIVGRISIPLPLLFSLSTIITLVGIGKILLSKKQ